MASPGRSGWCSLAAADQTCERVPQWFEAFARYLRALVRQRVTFDFLQNEFAVRRGEAMVLFSLDMSHAKQVIRPFTTIARPMQEGLAFRSKGSIGVAGRRRGERA
jgi:hypothetical protein